MLMNYLWFNILASMSGKRSLESQNMLHTFCVTLSTTSPHCVHRTWPWFWRVCCFRWPGGWDRAAGKGAGVQESAPGNGRRAQRLGPSTDLQCSLGPAPAWALSPFQNSLCYVFPWPRPTPQCSLWLSSTQHESPKGQFQLDQVKHKLALSPWPGSSGVYCCFLRLFPLDSCSFSWRTSVTWRAEGRKAIKKRQWRIVKVRPFLNGLSWRQFPSFLWNLFLTNRR